MPLKIWKKLKSSTVIKNDHWSYNLDHFEIEGGFKGQYHYVHTAGSTMVIPITPQNKFLLVKQFRYLNQKEGLEFPCGALEKGLKPKQNALKELREETGYTAGSLIETAHFAPYTGASDEVCTVYIARELVKAPLKGDATEEFELFVKTYEEIEALIEENNIWDGLTIAAWALVRKNFR